MGYDQKKYEISTKTIIRDLRPVYVRVWQWLKKKDNTLAAFVVGMAIIGFFPGALPWIDLIFLLYIFIFWLQLKSNRTLPIKLPAGSKFKDKNNMGPGKSGKAEGIMLIGNHRTTGEELWISGTDAKTHILYLGTTGSGKTEGLKSFACNALTWGSGFVYIDGKADTDLWSSLSSLVRRFGRDDDLLVLNYMTGNSDARAPSNTMNPFSSGSAAYLSAMLETLMPEAEGDNAMWKERAVALIKSLMPALTWKRDNQDMPLSISTIRNALNLDQIIKLSRDESLPQKITESLTGYLNTLPGYSPDAFDTNGKEKPLGPDQPMIDTTTVRQQHGYLTMQFTRALQSLGDDYGYIFDDQDADIDMVDVVLNRRILVTLIPALEKSPDETANLGKIIAATLKGMMGSTLGSNLEGESAKVIENKPSHSATPFMTIFDEVGYYTTAGMGVMAAQARSLGFCLIFAAQDLQAMEKRVKEEARSIAANTNLKIFGKLEDPTQTREFFENQTGKGNVMIAQNYKNQGGRSAGGYFDTQDASIQVRSRADYDDLKEQKEGEAIINFRFDVIRANIFYSNAGHASAMRVTRYVSLPPPEEVMIKHSAEITKLRDKLVSKTWTAAKADVALKTSKELQKIMEGFKTGRKAAENPVDHGIAAIGALHAHLYPEEVEKAGAEPSGAAMETIVKAISTAAPPLSAIPPQQSQSAGSSPLTAYTKKGQTDNPPAAAQESEPVSWNDLVKEAEEKPQSAPAQNAPQSTHTPMQKAEFIRQQLNTDVQRILSEAGANMRKTIFKSGKDNDASDAAE